MLNNKIVPVPVPKLVVGSDRDIYSAEKGYITFIRGIDAKIEDISTNQEHFVVYVTSKEARLAKLHCDLVHCPFIFKFYQSQYDYVDDNNISNNLLVDLWVD